MDKVLADILKVCGWSMIAGPTERSRGVYHGPGSKDAWAYAGMVNRGVEVHQRVRRANETQPPFAP